MSYIAGSQLAPGTTVAGYLIETLIGRGGMGAVYRAADERLGRKVALKVIAPELAQDERFRERFLRESRIAASLDHPHVIPIYQAGEEQGLLFLAMRYVEGTDLARLVAEEGALEPRRALDILSQIAEALDVAHEKGLVHRDVKPSNVLIASAAGREHCYLADFGLTKRTGSLSGVSVAGDIVGTLEYVAPEQITGEPLDERSDVYSLGCVLYECLTGQSPFPRATDVALLWAHVHEEPERASALRPELPRELDSVLTRALAKEPGRRYRTAGELVAATRSALKLVETPTVRQLRSSRRALASAGAVALVLLAALVAFVLTRDSDGISSVSPDSVGVIDPASNELVGEVAVGSQPHAIAVGEGAVWATNIDEETVSRIDPAGTARDFRIPVVDYPSDLAVGAGSVWVALGASAELVRINPEQSEAALPTPAVGEQSSPCGAPRANLAFGGGYLWFICENGELGRVSPRGGAASIGLEAGLLTSSSSTVPQFSDVAFGLGSVWVVNEATNKVSEIDPLTSQKQRDVTVGQEPAAIAVGENALWVANYADDTVTRVAIPSPGAPEVPTTFAVGDGPVDVAVSEDGVWVVNQLERTVMRLDPESGGVEAKIGIGNEPQRIAVGEGRVWVTVRAPEMEEEEG